MENDDGVPSTNNKIVNMNNICSTNCTNDPKDIDTIKRLFECPGGKIHDIFKPVDFKVFLLFQTDISI